VTGNWDSVRPILPARSAPPRLRVLCLAFIVVAACASGDTKPRYKVTGKVTFQSQPVEEGAITFEDPSAGEANSSPLASGGAYTVELPAGQYKVSISPPLVETKGTADSPPDLVPKKVNNIPRKYWVQESSGLSAEIAKDKQTADFDLKP
jgi:hypothetical protein